MHLLMLQGYNIVTDNVYNGMYVRCAQDMPFPLILPSPPFHQTLRRLRFELR